MLSLVQNLFGLAAGPFIGGLLSDAIGLDKALALMPLACLVAAASFVKERGGYQADRQRTRETAAATVRQGAFA